MNKQIREKIRAYFLELGSIHTSPHQIAFGFALGTFIAILPTPGFSILLGVLLILAYPKISKFALFGAMALFNPLVVIPFHVLSFKIGSLLFGTQPVVEYQFSILSELFQFTRRYLVGNLLVAFCTSSILYVITYLLTSVIKKLRS